MVERVQLLPREWADVNTVVLGVLDKWDDPDGGLLCSWFELYSAAAASLVLVLDRNAQHCRGAPQVLSNIGSCMGACQL